MTTNCSTREDRRHGMHGRLYVVSFPRYSEILVENRDFLINFYGATRMHSADNAVARCLSVRPSVRPSVSLSVRHTTIFCRNGYTRRKILFTSCRHTIPVFRTRRYSNITTGPPPPPLNGDVECKGVWRNRDFWPISHYTSDTIQVYDNDSYYGNANT